MGHLGISHRGISHRGQRPSRQRRHRREPLSSARGEGVISTAIAVLVMAFLGAAMWVAFNAIFDDAQERVDEQVGRIGE